MQQSASSASSHRLFARAEPITTNTSLMAASAPVSPAASASSSTSSPPPPPSQPSQSSRPSRPGRPTLARLDTSERLKTLSLLDQSAKSPSLKKPPSGNLRLQLDTTLPRRSSTISVHPATLAPPVPSKDASISPKSPRSFSRYNDHPPPTPICVSESLAASASAAAATTPATATATATSAVASSSSSSSPSLPSPLSCSTSNHSDPVQQSLQALCRMQAQMPPSPSSFGDMCLAPGARGTFAFDAGLGSLANDMSFQISTILPDFLYLGPNIQTQADVDELEKLGIRRILNMANEIDDTMGLARRFDGYLKIPMLDSVEAVGVQRNIDEACRFIDDARLHSHPTYVHCKAGKSRSVTIVMAYLIHANRWSLQRSYSFVVERRNAVSPNIGFVAELMRFEEKALNLPPKSSDQDDQRNPNPRDSMPPSASAPKLDPNATETEFKGSDGRYRARRPPVDEVNLAPGRRATIAGLGSTNSFG